MKECNALTNIGNYCREDETKCSAEEFLVDRLIRFGATMKTKTGFLNTCKGCIYHEKLELMAEKSASLTDIPTKADTLKIPELQQK